MNPLVSIVILNCNYPEMITNCLNTLAQTEGVEYETVVVDNGSEPATVEVLKQLQAQGKITTLVLEPTNRFFSGGNNIGVKHTNPASTYILLLNNDVAFLRPDWLTKMIAWMEGVPEYKPTIWGFHPTEPSPGPRDIVSIGWSYDENLPSRARPEGWCVLIRRSFWVDLSTDFAFHYGWEEAAAKMIRNGAKAGVLFNYAPYLVHREGGSRWTTTGRINDKRQPDVKRWFAGLATESLDFTLGKLEHETYISWSYLIPLINVMSIGSLLC